MRLDCVMDTPQLGRRLELHIKCLGEKRGMFKSCGCQPDRAISTGNRGGNGACFVFRSGRTKNRDVRIESGACVLCREVINDRTKPAPQWLGGNQPE